MKPNNRLIVLLSLILAISLMVAYLQHHTTLVAYNYKQQYDSLHIVDSLYKADSLRLSKRISIYSHKSDSLEKRCANYQKTILWMRLQHKKNVDTLIALHAPDSIILQTKLLNCEEERDTLCSWVNKLYDVIDIKDSIINTQSVFISECDTARLFSYNLTIRQDSIINIQNTQILKLKSTRRWVFVGGTAIGTILTLILL